MTLFLYQRVFDVWIKHVQFKHSVKPPNKNFDNTRLWFPPLELNQNKSQHLNTMLMYDVNE